MKTRTFTELVTYKTFEERFRYLSVKAGVGVKTFGFERFINQHFYTSAEWRHVRNQVIARDRGLDLGVFGHEIYDRVIVHHMNPMTIEDVYDHQDDILNPEYLITTSHRTHNAIHYGDSNLLYPKPAERRPGDTKLW